MFLTVRPISDLAEIEGEGVEWIWQGVIARGAITLLSAKWKVGKTTLLLNLLRACSQGEEAFCGRELSFQKCLIISEEGLVHWTRRRKELEASREISVQTGTFRTGNTAENWRRMIADIASEIKINGFGLIVIDTLFSLWPVKDENDAAQVRNALMPLNELADLGAGVLLVAHTVKGDAPSVSSFRGSGSLGGFVDVIVEMKQHQASARSERQISVIGRFDHPDPFVINYDESEGYTYSGSARELGEEKWRSRILEVLSRADLPQSFDSLRKKLSAPEGYAGLGKLKLKKILTKMIESGDLGRAGTGKKGDPYLYSQAPLVDSIRSTPLSLGGDWIELKESSEWDES